MEIVDGALLDCDEESKTIKKEIMIRVSATYTRASTDVILEFLLWNQYVRIENCNPKSQLV